MHTDPFEFEDRAIEMDRYSDLCSIADEGWKCEKCRQGEMIEVEREQLDPFDRCGRYIIYYRCNNCEHEEEVNE